MDAVSRETLLSLLPDDADSEAMQAYHDLLAGNGVEQGLIGPREAPRLWDRHLLNSAVVVVPPPGLVPFGARVADVGSGAGLPGLVWALARPDLSLILIEPLLRRATFLQDAVTRLNLGDRVEVIRERAENLVGIVAVDIVTARAVAPLERLAGWTLPLLVPGGTLLALKGQSAQDEIERAGASLRRLGAGEASVVLCGTNLIADPTRVVVVARSH